MAGHACTHNSGFPWTEEYSNQNAGHEKVCYAIDLSQAAFNK